MLKKLKDLKDKFYLSIDKKRRNGIYFLNHVSKLDDANSHKIIKMYSSIKSTQPLIFNISSLYPLLNSKEKTSDFYIVNPFTGLHTCVSFIFNDENKLVGTHVVIDRDQLNRADYEKAFHIRIDVNHFLSSMKNKNKHLTDEQLRCQFDIIFFHELAHTSFTQITLEDGWLSEQMADISSVIKTIKNNNLTLKQSVSLIDDLLKYRTSKATFNKYYIQDKSKVRDHATEISLIHLRQITQESFDYLKQIEDKHITYFALYLARAIVKRHANIFNVDKKNIDKMRMMLSNQLNINQIFESDKSIVEQYRFYSKPRDLSTTPITNYEKNGVIHNLFKNAVSDISIFDDVLLVTLLNNSFDSVISTLVNINDFRYTFLDVVQEYERYLEQYNNIQFDTVNTFKDKKSLYQFVYNNHKECVYSIIDGEKT